jgi:type I restriction enzyme, S subunit
MRAGGTPVVDDPSMWDEDGLPWVAIADMTQPGAVVETNRSVSPEGIAGKSLPIGRPGTLLFAMYASVGAVNVLGTEASWNQAILGLEPLPGLADTRFTRYWLEHLQPDLSALTRSNTQDNLNAEQVGNLPFPLLDLSSQRRIADYLDREAARINALMEARRRMMALLKERDRADLSHMMVPENVDFAHLRYFATVQGGVTVDSTRDAGPDAVTRPYLRVANVQSGMLDLADVTEITVSPDMAKRSTLRPNDVLMTEGGDIDKLGRGTVWEGQLDGCLHQNHIFAVRPNPKYLDSWYLAFITQSSQARSYFESTGVQSTNLASISSSKILGLRVPVLPLRTQREMVRRWKLKAARTRTMNLALERQMKLLNERREAVITAAVTGQLDIPEAA